MASVSIAELFHVPDTVLRAYTLIHVILPTSPQEGDATTTTTLLASLPKVTGLGRNKGEGSAQAV